MRAGCSSWRWVAVFSGELPVDIFRAVPWLSKQLSLLGRNSPQRILCSLAE